jgi:hypothetical protein
MALLLVTDDPHGLHISAELLAAAIRVFGSPRES